MTTRDLIGLSASYVYAFGLIALAEMIRRWRGYPQDFTRKIVHIGAGMWVFGVLALFDTWYIGIIPFATFIILNYIFYRYRIFSAMDAPDSTPGTVYFAFSITVLFVMLWRTNSPQDRGYIAAAAVMAMTWGDALAAIVGQRWGQHRYTVVGSTRSWEGSMAMFVASAVTMALTLLLVPGSPLGPLSMPPGLIVGLLAAVLGAAIVTVAEAFSPSGTDNLSVPLLAGVVLFGVIALNP
ncbi:MAG: phosphatidate cytidylyltransferase [Chloroflexales bacterium]|nr:phosphatidate cytidylyltransferase [Chloroflexales bacterium]